MSRYNRRETALNFDSTYKELFEKRGITRLEQFKTPKFKAVDPEVLILIDSVIHRWQKGDSFWLLAHKTYGNSEYWWVIAGFNRKPTETHLNPGDHIRIPISLAQALEVLK